ncbi:bestrophin family protein [Owenweeksia hongkongensis]|uniref:bestrophin family protein n=1 Tax=Owenweeksia hongkongensis TaxID=253245 RepID=UPI003A8E44E3
MVVYNAKDWFGLIFKFHKAETFHKLRLVMLSLAVYTAIICVIEIDVYHLQYASTTAVHSLLGFVISLLLVFRTNTAYDRWWEGRKQWGALVNVSRNFSLKINAFIPKEEKERKMKLAAMTAAYAGVLRDHLRNESTFVVASNLPDFMKNEVGDTEHIPNFLANAMQHSLLEMYQKEEISEGAYLAMLQDLNAFTDICGACERIKKTPIPYTYNIFIKKFIFAYIMTMPFGFVSDFGYWTVGITIFTFYALASLELIAEEIEDPFGKDSNDLPTDGLAETIAKNVAEVVR